MSRRTLAIILLVSLMLIAAVPSFAWKFASMADSRGSNNGVNTVTLTKIVDLINSEKVDLVLFQGDAVGGTKDDAALSSQMDTWLAVTSKLNCPWYYTPGNHEISTGTSESILRSKVDQPMNGPVGHKEMVFSFDHENAHFAAVNSNHYGAGHHMQRAWLAADLAATKQPHRFVMGHYPAYPKGPHIKSSLDQAPSERDDFWNILNNSGVEMYFCGHEHLYARSKHRSVYQIINGTCGAPISKNVKGTIGEYHYVVVDVDGNRVRCQTKSDAGEVLDTWSYEIDSRAASKTSSCCGVGASGSTDCR